MSINCCLVILSLGALCISALVCAPAIAKAPSESVRITDNIGVSEAMLKGDIGALASIAAKNGDHVNGLYSRSAMLRLQFDFEASLAVANKCKDRALREQNPGAAFSCALIELNDLFDLGRYRDWVVLGRNVMQSASVYLSPRYGSQATLHYFEAAGHFQSEVVSDLNVIKADSGFVPFKAYSFHAGSIDYSSNVGVTAKINGKVTAMAFDTGSISTLLRDLAATGTAPAHDKSQAPIYGQVKSLVFGETSLAGVAAAAPTRAQLPNILGMNAINKLGAVSISSHGVRVYGPSDRARPACTQPLTIYSLTNDAAYKIRLPLSVNGKRVDAFLDTGADSYLNPHDQAAMTELAKLDFGFGSLARHVLVTRASGGGYSVGNKALADIDVYIDFNARHLCVYPANGLSEISH